MSLTLCWVSGMEGRKVSVRWILGEFNNPMGGIDLGPPELDFNTLVFFLLVYPEPQLWGLLHQWRLSLLRYISSKTSHQHLSSAHLKTDSTHVHVLNIWFFSNSFSPNSFLRHFYCWWWYRCVPHLDTYPCPWPCHPVIGPFLLVFFYQ